MLTVITGPMFSGKSSALISRGVSHVIAGDIVVAFKPKNDDRYDARNITTHYGDKFAAIPIGRSLVINEACAYLYGNNIKPDVIMFDEAQFFNSGELKSAVEFLLINYRCHIIAAGLAQDSFGKPFGDMPELLSRADNIVCLKAVCSRCKKINSATRTYRKTKDKSQVVVGGIDAYEPRCFGCWNEV